MGLNFQFQEKYGKITKTNKLKGKAHMTLVMKVGDRLISGFLVLSVLQVLG
jgi:hypothetical protein